MNFDHITARIAKPTTKANSERAELLERFVTRLNASRVAGGYKPLGAKFYAMKMSHIETDELHAFYKKLDSARNFSSLWYYYCVPKKN
jgi:nucleoside diphosphate kinase